MTAQSHSVDELTALATLSTSDATCERIVYLAPDCTDSAVKKRAHGFIGLGHNLACFSFRRDRYCVGHQPDWPNIELGTSQEKRLVARLFMSLKALAVIFRHRLTWRCATMLYVRNLDLALLSIFGRAITRSRAPLVYEVLDIHPALLDRGIRGAILRWCERRILQRCSLLVVSSEAFASQYFRPVQRFTGATFLLENKWSRESALEGSRKLPYQLDLHDPVWVIGWFGNLRCQQSLEILSELADALPHRVKIYLRGCVSLLGQEPLDRALRGRPNILFEGEYSAPEDLAAIYSQVHFNWCADLSGGANSLWLLPNRLYEGGYFGIPALAIASHETGRTVVQRRLGEALEAPYVAHLKKLLLRMTHEDYVTLRRGIEELPAETFLDAGELRSLVHTVRDPSPRVKP